MYKRFTTCFGLIAIYLMNTLVHYANTYEHTNC